MIGMTRNNTTQKYLWLVAQAEIKKRELKFSAHALYFDEMESIIHTKCKPVSIALVVNEKYEILEAKVSEMPAKGRLAHFAKRKYGFREDNRDETMGAALQIVKEKLTNTPTKIISDAKPSYRKWVEKYFPHSSYSTHSRADKDRHRDRLHENKEKKRFDPLFPLNQRCAKLRCDIKRLTRRSWCTSKKIENLQGHLDLYIASQFA